MARVPLPPAFQQLDATGGVLEGELFLGATGFEAARLWNDRRALFPPDAWALLAVELAQRWATAPEPMMLWGFGPKRFGLCVDGSLLLLVGENGVGWASNRDTPWRPPGPSHEHRSAAELALTLEWLTAPRELDDGIVAPYRPTWTHVDVRAVATLQAAAEGQLTRAELHQRLEHALQPLTRSRDLLQRAFFCDERPVRGRANELRMTCEPLPPAWAQGALEVALDQAREFSLSVPERPPLTLDAQGQAPVTLPTTSRLMAELQTRTGLLLLRRPVLAGRGPVEFDLRRLRHPPDDDEPLVVVVRHPDAPTVNAVVPAVRTPNGRVTFAPGPQPALETLLKTLTPAQSSADDAPAPVVRSVPDFLSWSVGAGLAVLAVFTLGVVVTERRGWWFATPVVFPLAAVMVRRALEQAPWRNVPGLALTLGAGGLLADARASLPGGVLGLLGALVAWALVQQVRGLSPNRLGGWFPGSRWGAAPMHRELGCGLCGRRHPQGAWFERCQFQNCRAALPVGDGCVCGRCASLPWPEKPPEREDWGPRDAGE